MEPNCEKDVERKCIDNIQEDCSEMGLSLIEADKLARDRGTTRDLL